MINLKSFALTLSMLIIFNSCNQPDSDKKLPVEEKKKSAAEAPYPVSDPNIRIFMSGVDSADLSDLFIGTGPFTAFVPSNEAVEKFGKDKWDNLLKPENKDQLASILIYHIVPGKYLEKNLKSRTLKTINGKNIQVTVENGEIHINNAKVIKTDMIGSNGVIHEIDTVLIP